jgi:HSP20 family protein
MFKTNYRNYAVPGLRTNHFLHDLLNNELAVKEGWQKKSTPAANVKESAEKFQIELAAPGMQKTDFVIRVEEGVLIISSEKKKEEVTENEKFTRKEFSYHAFSRSFAIPENVDEDAIKAAYENGILSVELPKKTVETKENKRQIVIS